MGIETVVADLRVCPPHTTKLAMQPGDHIGSSTIKLSHPGTSTTLSDRSLSEAETPDGLHGFNMWRPTIY